MTSAQQEVELVKKDIEVRDAELPKTAVWLLMMPLAKAVKNLNQQVGL